MTAEPANPKKTGLNDTDRRYLALAGRIIVEFGADIAVPVVALAMFGKWLDSKYGTRPYLLIAGFVLAFLISASVIWRRAKKFGKEYEDIGSKKV